MNYIDKYIFIYKESHGSLDYLLTQSLQENKIYLINGIAYTDYGTGNFLWGYTLAGLNIPRERALKGAWFNNFINGRRDNPDISWYRVNIFWDDPADTRAIKYGYGANMIHRSLLNGQSSEWNKCLK